MYRYISRESCSQFDSLPLTSLTISCQPRNAILDALQSLYVLGALTVEGALTPLGAQMTALPLDPPLARCLVAAASEKLRCAAEVVTIVAMLCAGELFFRAPNATSERRGGGSGGGGARGGGGGGGARGGGDRAPRSAPSEGERRRRQFAHPQGDHLTYLRIWAAYVEAGRRSASGEAAWCKEFSIHGRAMRSARDIRAQLEQHMRGTRPPLAIESEEARHLARGGTSACAFKRTRKALCNGFFTHAAALCAHDTYRTLPLFPSIDGAARVCSAHPSSVVAAMATPPQCVVCVALSRLARARGARRPPSVCVREAQQSVPILTCASLPSPTARLPRTRAFLLFVLSFLLFAFLLFLFVFLLLLSSPTARRRFVQLPRTRADVEVLHAARRRSGAPMGPLDAQAHCHGEHRSRR